jgi:hypothetical protein
MYECTIYMFNKGVTTSSMRGYSKTINNGANWGALVAITKEFLCYFGTLLMVLLLVGSTATVYYNWSFPFTDILIASNKIGGLRI